MDSSISPVIFQAHHSALNAERRMSLDGVVRMEKKQNNSG